MARTSDLKWLGLGVAAEWVCGDPSCEVCWLWRRDGESRSDWLARVSQWPAPRYRRVRLLPPR